MAGKQSTGISTHRRAWLEGQTRRHFLRAAPLSLGGLWLAGQMRPAMAAGGYERAHDPSRPMGPLEPPQPARAKRVIFLHMAGAPSQLELFEYKPELQKLDGRPCPEEFLKGKRFAFIRGTPNLLGPQFPMAQHGQCGAWVSDRLPEFAKHVDRVAFIHTMQTDQFNHAPAQLLVHTGNANLGYPSLGSWVTYGLGSEAENLPGFVVLCSGGKNPDAGKAAWGSGFLPGVYQGVQCRSDGDPVLFLEDPPGFDRRVRRRMLDAIAAINQQTFAEVGDPETITRIAQYELAFQMQVAANEAFDIARESAAVHERYGVSPGQESFANNCLLARRLVERGVRFVQLFDWGWDAHGASSSEALNAGFKDKCQQIDRPVAALLQDLHERGLLSDTLVVWGGEFGRTPMRENRGGAEMALVGRDHHAEAFTMWCAGGGIKGGLQYGETDPLGYAPITEPVLMRDLHHTILHLLGFQAQRLSVPFRGLDQRLIGVQESRVVEALIA